MDRKLSYGLLGKTLKHSFSKLIHEQLCDYEYNLIELDEVQLDRFLSEKSFKAVNVTIPYKQTVIKYLDYIDESARKIGAVNTIVNKNGSLYGYNTDYYGMKYMLERSKIELCGKTVLLLGNGGTCKTAAAVCGDSGASRLLIASRSEAPNTISYEQAYERSDEVEIIINTSPVGMYPNNGGIPIEAERFSRLCGAADVIYNPLKTMFLRQIEKLGLPYAAGLPMLVAQAKLAAEHFTDKKIDDGATEEIIESIARSQRNIVLIGMPGSGKSALARKIAEEFSMPLIDLDSEIVKRAKKPIAEIFENEGEAAFRALESEIIAELSAQHSTVIATGGGVVKNERNIDFLKGNGKLIYIDRPVERLKLGGGRPLSQNRSDVEEIYRQRRPLYEKYADITIKNDGSFAALCKKAIEEIRLIRY